MRKKILALIMIGGLVGGMLTGCGNSKNEATKEITTKEGSKIEYEEEPETTETTEIVSSITSEEELFDEIKANAKSIVKLADYKNVVEIPAEGKEITDEDVDNSMQELLAAYGNYFCDHVDGTVASDSRVAVEYSMTDEMSGTQQYPEQIISIGDNMIVDGFDDILVGKNTGDTFNETMTYPDTWWNPEQIGKEVTIEGTILYLMGEPKYKEVSDEFVVEMTGGEYNTVEEFKEVQKTQLESFNVMNYGYSALMTVMDLSEITGDISDMIAWEINQMVADFETAYAITDEEAAANPDVEITEIWQNFGYESEDEYMAWIGEQAERNIKEMLVIYALADELSVEVTQGDMDEYIEQISAYYGTDADISAMTNDPHIQYSILNEKVTKALYEFQ